MRLSRERDLPKLASYLTDPSQASLEELALEILESQDMSFVENQGGYPMDVDLSTFPAHIITAQCDHDGAAGITIYRKKSLVMLVRKALDRTKELEGEDRLEGITDYFSDRVHKCQV